MENQLQVVVVVVLVVVVGGSRERRMCMRRCGRNASRKRIE